MGLPVTRRYLRPANRNIGLLWSAGGALCVALLLVGDTWFLGHRLVSNGPLSSSHASLERSCQSCHTPFGTVASDKCSACHEQYTSHLGRYTFNAHYVHVSGDLTRAGVRDGETSCATCHLEHRGRDATVSRVPDTRCNACHEVGSFSLDHPEFEFAAQGILDDTNLRFTHIRHVERVTAQYEVGLQASCLACHVPVDDGAHFAPIDFDRDCSACHLDDDASEELPITPRGTPLVADESGAPILALGVESLQTVRTRLGPGEQWAETMSPASFEGGDEFEVVAKLDLTHRDPWILHNLKRLRGAIYPNEGLTALLDAVGGDPAAERETLYAEALSTVSAYADGLRGRAEPWVQADLAEVDRLVALVDRKLSDPRTALQDERFRLATPDSRLSVDQRAEITAFAGEVAAPCLQCHTMENALIARVQQDQRVLRRAKFNHRAHAIQRDCLYCHTNIPVDDFFEEETDVDPAVDNATIQNIPRIDACRACHTSSQSSETCQTCHDFHPNTGVVAGMVRRLE